MKVEFINGVCKEHVDKFKDICNELSELMECIQEYCPEANIYIGDGQLYLMNGPTHDDNCCALDKNIVMSFHKLPIDGGGW